jgi:hypothetical protein
VAVSPEVGRVCLALEDEAPTRRLDEGLIVFAQPLTRKKKLEGEGQEREEKQLRCATKNVNVANFRRAKREPGSSVLQRVKAGETADRQPSQTSRQA